MWKEQGIYGLIQLSRVGLRYNHAMFLTTMCLWEVSTNNFHFPCGMITPTLFDLTAIVCLWHTGEDYEPFADTDFRISSHSYSTFIEEYQGSCDIVDSHEHIAFMTY